MITKFIIIAFMLLEFSNVIVLYFLPGSKQANAVGVFSAWGQSKQYPEIHDFVKYLVNWVAGAKLIFLLLLLAILLYGSEDLQRASLIALSLATITFYWRLFPIIRKMDKNGQINPKNYSIYLGSMIFVMIVLFALAALIK